MQKECRRDMLREIEELVAEARSGAHGGKPFLDGLHYGLLLAGLVDDPEIQQSWARGEARAAQKERIHN